MRRLLGVAVCLLALPSFLPAQSSDDRHALEQVRDSLGAMSDTVDLIRLEMEWIGVARVDRDNALLHLRLGFLALRLGELGGKDHYDDAGSEFEWAAELEPEWPYAWYGLGLAESGLARNPGNILFGVTAWLNKDQRTVAVGDFSRAATADPSFMPALEALSESTEEQEINRRPQLALAAFRRGLDTEAAADPLFHLYRGRLERSFGSVELSIDAFDAYRRLGGEVSMADLETARSQFMVDSLDGTAAYYAGAAGDDSLTVAGYRSDLTAIVEDSVLQAFDRASGAERASFLKIFWTTRDDEALQARGARLREHYARLAVARRTFPRSPFTRRYLFGEYYRDNDTDFDDRGVIYVRHGEPTMRRQLVAPQSEAYGAEGWRYQNADGHRDFYFLATEDPQDYRLRATPLDLPIANRTDFLQDFEPRLTTAGGASRARYAQEIFIQGKDNIAVGTTTDTYELRFDRSVESIAQVMTAGGSQDGNVLHVAVAVPVDQLEAIDSGGVSYSLTIRAVARNADGLIVARIDSTRVWRLEQHDSVTHVLERVSVPVSPGWLEIRVAVINGDGGGVFPRDTIEVLSGGATEARMSVPVLGRRTPRIAWPIPASPDSVFFNPLETFPLDGDLEVYYELYGLTPGIDYQTTIEVSRPGKGLFSKVFGGGGKKISLSFQQLADGPVTRVSRTLGLQELDQGTYRLVLSLTGPGGIELQHERLFEVVE